jgi:hypothetical protein
MGSHQTLPARSFQPRLVLGQFSEMRSPLGSLWRRDLRRSIGRLRRRGMRWSEVGQRSRIYPKQIVSHDAPPKACETHRRSGDRCGRRACADISTFRRVQSRPVAWQSPKPMESGMLTCSGRSKPGLECKNSGNFLGNSRGTERGPVTAGRGCRPLPPEMGVAGGGGAFGLRPILRDHRTRTAASRFGLIAV